MINLPEPVFVVTGCLRVEGAEKRTQTQKDDGSFAGTRQVNSYGRKGMNVATNYMRKLRTIAVLKTPFGSLVREKDLPRVKALIDDAAQRCMSYNREAPEGIRMWNFMVWEGLDGNRRAAVEGWLMASQNDPKVARALKVFDADAN